MSSPIVAAPMALGSADNKVAIAVTSAGEFAFVGAGMLATTTTILLSSDLCRHAAFGHFEVITAIHT